MSNDTQTLCFNWKTSWPHASHDITAIRTTDDVDKVTCEACLWALGSQQRPPTLCDVERLRQMARDADVPMDDFLAALKNMVGEERF